MDGYLLAFLFEIIFLLKLMKAQPNLPKLQMGCICWILASRHVCLELLKTSNRHQESPDPISVTQLELSVPGLDPGHQACLPRITEDIQQASRITRPDFSDTARIIRF
jgi:hypothetical protein